MHPFCGGVNNRGIEIVPRSVDAAELLDAFCDSLLNGLL